MYPDPLSMSPQKGLELIGNNLQKQYERWQPRARYKQLLDPTTEEVRKLCLTLRKNAKVKFFWVLECHVEYFDSMNECCFITMVMEFQNQLKMEKFGFLTRLVLG